MFPILQIGPLALQTPGLILLVGLWLGLTIAERHARRYEINPDLIYNLTFIVLIAGLVGARLAVAIRFPASFADNPASLISLNPSLLDPAGGAAAALLASLIYGQRRGLVLKSTLDALIPVFAILGIAIPIANLASGSAFGAPSELPWAIDLWGASRHPTQIYQALAGGLILWLVWPSRQEKNNIPGSFFLKFLALSAAARLFLEAFRGDSLIIFDSLRAAQIVAWIILALSWWGILQLQKTEQG
ncbi:MAG: prolipoprotein diacylglyceryl transferase [Chloroflexi bacterium]|nr:prolipoprotein diacylglyceryl transferase [Chloroflexota bacterium]